MKILIAIDSSTFAGEVIKQVCNRTWPAPSRLQLITVVESVRDWDLQQQLHRECEEILAQRLNELRRKLPDCEIAGSVNEGGAAQTINKVAEEFGADLIIIGSHGDTGPRQAHIGSVAAAVVNNARCSVEVVKLRELAVGSLSGADSASATR